MLAGPPLSGAALSSAGVRYAWVAVLWASTGVGMAVSDWLVNREDIVFHLVLAGVMALLAGAGWGVVRLTQRRTPASGAGAS